MPFSITTVPGVQTVELVFLVHNSSILQAVHKAYWIRTLQTPIPHGLNSAHGKHYYPYDHSLALSVSSPQMLFLPPHNHSETAHKIQAKPYHPHRFIFIKAGFNLGFPEVLFQTGFFSQEVVGQQPPKSFIHFSFLFSPHPQTTTHKSRQASASLTHC